MLGYPLFVSAPRKPFRLEIVDVVPVTHPSEQNGPFFDGPNGFPQLSRMATSNSPTCGRANSSRQDDGIVGLFGFFLNGCSASEARQAEGERRGAVGKPRTPQGGRPQACPVDGWLVHGGRVRQVSPSFPPSPPAAAPPPSAGSSCPRTPAAASGASGGPGWWRPSSCRPDSCPSP